ncbi:MAG: polysaccharide deacetylase family protein [Rikenellaceae bacterium]
MRHLAAVIILMLTLCTASTAQSITKESITIAKYRGDKQCAISYTFDDGYLDHYTKVFPQLQRLGIRGTFWLNGKAIEEREAEAKAGNPRMTWAHIKEMSDAGQEMSNHSWSHPHFKSLPLSEVRIEIEKNDSIILANTGRKPITFCYPFTQRTPEIIKIAMEGKVGTRLKQKPIGQNKNRCTDQSLNDWMDSVIASGGWESAMIHGISCSFDYFDEIDLLWRHFERAKANEAKIWIDTFAAVSAYIAERDDTKLDFTESRKSITIKPTTTLDPNLYTEPLTMVVKTDRRLTAKQDGKQLKVTTLNDRQLFDFNPNGGEITIK